jgi:hypothetical protein
MSEWQPIESAPKDGTPVLLWTKEWGAVVGRHDGYGIFGVSPPGEEMLGGATHWMPLPTPPAPQGAVQTITIEELALALERDE